MALTIAVGEDVQVELIGQRTTVPNDNIAKLMYYLSTLSSCLDHMIPDDYTSYTTYYNLSYQDKVEVVTLAILLSPDLLMGKVIFPVEAGDPILNGLQNNFYKITSAKTVVAAATNLVETIVIGEKSISVSSIMVFTLTWLENNYINPILAEKRRLEPSPPKQNNYVVMIDSPPPKQNNYVEPLDSPSPPKKTNRVAQLDIEDVPNHRDSPPPKKSCCSCCCCIIVLIVLVIVIVVVLLPLMVIPYCTPRYTQEFVKCWECLIARNLTCS